MSGFFEAAGEAFNIGAGGREFLIDVYHNICKALNKEVEPNFGPDRKEISGIPMRISVRRGNCLAMIRIMTLPGE